ncbi:MAG: hypothetical protein HYZ17_14155 [Betaproteobacteria bacterium]|nr:hypothetical protein [Betaproteobacteria bacterium]
MCGRRGRINLPLLAGLLFCGEALAAPCFSVSGTIVSVHQLFAGEANAKTIDLEDMPSVSTMISRGPEAHNLIFMNIKRDAAKKNVASFSVKIDGKTYQYPRDVCPKK